MQSTTRPDSAPSDDDGNRIPQHHIQFSSLLPRHEADQHSSGAQNGNLPQPARAATGASALDNSLPGANARPIPSRNEGQQERPAHHHLPAASDDVDPWQGKTLLTLDGGGIRGYSTLLILRALMIAIARHEQAHPAAPSSVSPLENPPDQNEPMGSSTSENTTREPLPLGATSPSSVYLPCHYFDYMAGTSTGGLIAIMLGRLRMNVDDCITEYETLGRKVFGRPRTGHVRSILWWPRDKYDHHNLESVIESVVARKDATRSGNATFPSNEQMCRTIVVAWQKIFLKGVRVPYLFRSYRHIRGPTLNPLERNPDQTDNYPICQVGRATSAAPFYFKAVRIGGGDERFEFVDGGFGANNPSVEAHEEVKIMNNDRNSAVAALVSIGTGKLTESKPLRGAGLPMYYAYFNVAKKWATYSETTHETMLRIVKGSPTRYFRLNVEGEIASMKLDEFKTRGARCLTFEKLRHATEAYLERADVRQQLDDCARLLVERRRRRAHGPPSDRWEQFCFGVEYCCNFPQCTRDRRFYGTRALLRSHLQDLHRPLSEDHIEFWLDKGKMYLY